jgi:hypothetical protein
MVRNIGFTLTGKKEMYNINNITGINWSSNKNPIDVENLKIAIINKFIIPFISKNWKVLEENSIFIEKITQKIKFYSSIYNSEYLALYKDIMPIFEMIINQHLEINNLEKKIYNTNDTISLVIKTPFIKLKPEYELYNLILGKPNLHEGCSYNDVILQDITNILNIDDITFDKIKIYISNKYSNII